jgi:hypothetical protein
VLQQVENSHIPFVQRPVPPTTQQSPAGSEQAVPLGLLVVEQPPLPSQVALFWQELWTQLYAVPAQTPAAQTSLRVQGLPSLQPVPLGLLTGVQPPDPLHVELVWHWFTAQK